MDTDTQSWRENVVGSLAEIKSQLARLASDRESEKDTLIRVTRELHDEDRRQTDRLQSHVEWNDREHAALHEKYNKVSGRMIFFTGVFLTLQFVAPFVWMVLTK